MRTPAPQLLKDAISESVCSRLFLAVTLGWPWWCSYADGHSPAPGVGAELAHSVALSGFQSRAPFAHPAPQEQWPLSLLWRLSIVSPALESHLQTLNKPSLSQPVLS